MTRPSAFIVLSLALAASLVAAIACGGSGGQEIVRERDGVRLTLSVNGETFDVGETIELSVEAENLRDGPLTYGFVPADQPALQLQVTSDLAGPQMINTSDEPYGGANLTLDPGDSIETESEWDQTLDVYITPVQAPEGEYTIEAGIVVDDPAGGQPVSIIAAATVTLRGGEAVLPVVEAVRTAIQHPDLVEWMSERGFANAVCLYQPTETFFSALVATGAVEEDILPELYRVNLDNGRPVCSPVSTGDEWRVQFFASSGEEPHSVAVYMDIHTGENTRWEEGDLEPLQPPP